MIIMEIKKRIGHSNVFEKCPIFSNRHRFFSPQLSWRLVSQCDDKPTLSHRTTTFYFRLSKREKMEGYLLYFNISAIVCKVKLNMFFNWLKNTSSWNWLFHLKIFLWFWVFTNLQIATFSKQPNRLVMR